MKSILAGLAVSLMVAACGTAPRKQEWFDRGVTPPGKYQDAKFADSTDTAIQSQLIKLEKLEPALAKDPEGDADVESRRIIRTLARGAQGPGLTRVCEHIVWKLSSQPSSAAVHEAYLLDFMSRCQDVIFQMTGDDEPTIENLGAYTLNASQRGPFLRVLLAKADHAVATFKRESGVLYAALVCNILERTEWGAVRRIPREPDPDAPAFRSSTLNALSLYRQRISR